MAERRRIRLGVPVDSVSLPVMSSQFRVQVRASTEILPIRDRMLPVSAAGFGRVWAGIGV